MKKLKSIPVYILILVLSSIFIISCSNDPVTPIDLGPYQFDSARYYWSFKTLNLQFFTFHAFDTSNIVFLEAYNLFLYDGINFTAHNFGFDGLSAVSMGCFDKNNIFIGGSDNSIGSNN